MVFLLALGCAAGELGAFRVDAGVAFLDEQFVEETVFPL